MDDSNTNVTRLLTLLNSTTPRIKSSKRKQPLDNDFIPSEKLNKRRKAVRTDELVPDAIISDEPANDVLPEPAQDDTMGEMETEESSNAWEDHFGTSPNCLSEPSRTLVDNSDWKISKSRRGKLGNTSTSTINGNTIPETTAHNISVLERLYTPFTQRQSKQNKDNAELQTDVLSTLSSYADLYATATPWESQKSIREAITLHALDHVTRKRRRVLKNNERISHATKARADPPEDIQDQGFTRPSVLVLLPFRSSALAWFNALASHTPSPAYQIENQARFLTEYGLPPGAVDKLVSAEPGTYPRDHVETFKGNVDDNFRLGIKMTRKSVKLFSEFYGCDIILASPLGLRMTLEKEKNADFLSSIELMIVDQMDVLSMQNWEHVRFVFSNLNKLPKESHDADFSRIKPWYLDGHAAYLRQTILLSAYETPEMRSLYNSELKNVAGKIRTERRYSPAQVPEGIDQEFVSFDCASPKDEPEKRFNFFVNQLLPTIMKSAVQSTNTLIFVPSSFDFIRIHNYFRKQTGVSFTVLSEFASNQDISRARQAFFSSKKSFLLVSERFHFFRRYKIRGIRNLIFYGPPDHAQFYTEYLTYPFLDKDVEASDVTCKVLFSKYDWYRMERIAGTKEALELIQS